MRTYLVKAHIEGVFPHTLRVTPHIQGDGESPPRMYTSSCCVHSHLTCTQFAILYISAHLS